MSRKSLKRELVPVSEAVLRRLRRICRQLPEAYEEVAWVGVRWRIRRQTFAHVLMIDEGWPPAYADASGVYGSACVLTFRNAQRSSQPSIFDSHPFFRPRWFPNIVGMIIEERVEWRQVELRVQESYRLMAPRQLAFADLTRTHRTR